MELVEQLFFAWSMYKLGPCSYEALFVAIMYYLD